MDSVYREKIWPWVYQLAYKNKYIYTYIYSTALETDTAQQTIDYIL